MKTRAELFIEQYSEMKKYLYSLSQKWYAYGKEMGLSDWEMGFYNYEKKKLSDLTFEYYEEDKEFKIGYEFTDRCGDTDYFNTYFTLDQILNEDLIKQKIDKKHKEKKEKQERENLEKRKQEILKLEKEKKLYEELKQKFEN